MDEVKQIVGNIKKGNIAPIYFLTGEEPFYIDKISEFIEKNVLTEEERGFNQVILYGKDIGVDDIVGNAKRYPMMAERQVVIIKEAQHLSRTIENLVSYALNPQPSTVLVICYKYNKLDKRKKLYKAINKTGIIFESKKLYENKVADWIRTVLKSRGYDITFKAANLLVEFLGTDLGKIDKELEKLCLVVPKGTQITPEAIEENIGISKDYNNFELKKAIGERDVVKATRIVNYFAQNPKDNPFVLTVTLLYSFFNQLLNYHGLKDHSPKNVSSALGIRPFFVEEIQIAARNYPMRRVSEIISELRELDLKGKGVGASISHQDLLKELVVKLFR
ncbi:DNA polymerase III subunit delta [Arenibacter certesii]|uniref:DNA polymerase III subunit delta n=1 Tax=Arenibacter certesii TaxID=228955 RepID=A0A918IU14_9FLAO|nr:DNA polymerase III subunit delta [Arenibacter certesii]GGW32048.1 DNA polymerase III subunit delta [Arenibacter certesii]